MRWLYAHSADIGPVRCTMEDTCAEHVELCSNEHESCHFFAIFDGHGGTNCSQYLVDGLPTQLIERQIMVGEYNLFSEDSVIEDAFIEADALFLREAIEIEDESGSTATSVILRYIPSEKKVEIICANTGDSRTVLFDGHRTIALSTDHKPENEMQRIVKAGGRISNGRVLGLAVTRTFGDSDTKMDFTGEPQQLREMVITPLPEITRTMIDLGDKNFKFIVLACDGVWDVLSDEDVTTFIRQWADKAPDITAEDLQIIANDLIRIAVDKGSTDNISICIVLI